LVPKGAFRKQNLLKIIKMESLKYFNLSPSAGGSFSFGWRKMFEKSFLPLLLTVIIVGIIDGPTSAGMNWNWDDGAFGWPMLFIVPFAILGLAYKFLLVPVIKYGENYLFLKVMRDEEADLRLLFEGFKTKYLNIILANLIVFALAIIGFMMLIIPGIIVVCRLAFVPYLVMDKDLEPMKAVEKSWQMTRGHGWTIFGMMILSIFIFLGGLLVFFFGVIISFMWINAAFASMYLAVLNQTDDDNPIPILGVTESDE
jgi:MFS family permease